MEIDKIISAAIPPEDCQVKESHAKWRRERLKIAIEQLLQQRDRSQPYQPKMEYKDGGSKGVVNFPSGPELLGNDIIPRV